MHKNLSRVKVFSTMADISQLTDLELEKLRGEMYKPSFTKQTLNYSTVDIPPLSRFNSWVRPKMCYANYN